MHKEIKLEYTVLYIHQMYISITEREREKTCNRSLPSKEKTHMEIFKRIKLNKRIWLY